MKNKAEGEAPPPPNPNDSGEGERASAERTWNLLPCEWSSEWGRGPPKRSGGEAPPPPNPGERVSAERTWNLLPCERSNEWGRGPPKRSGGEAPPPPSSRPQQKLGISCEIAKPNATARASTADEQPAFFSSVLSGSASAEAPVFLVFCNISTNRVNAGERGGSFLLASVAAE